MHTTGKHNIDTVIKAVEGLEAKADNLSPVFDEIANHLYNVTEEALESNSSPDGAAWEPLSPFTIKRKGHDRMLDDKGDMRENITIDSDHESSTIGTNSLSEDGYPYPAVQHFGTDDGRVPARPFLPFDEDGDLMPMASDGIVDLVLAHFEDE